LPTPRLAARIFGLIFLTLAFNPSIHAADSAASSSASTLPPPVQLTAGQDRQRMMDLLHIKSLRPGASGNPNAPNAANYDESKANPYPKLPDPLLLNDGQRVTTAKMWWDERRPQIGAAFDEDVYGKVPAHTPKVNWEVVSTKNEIVGGVPVITKKLIGHVDNSSYPLVTVNIDLTVSTPANATGPVPVIMEFGLSPEILAMIRKHFTPEQWAALAGKGASWQQQVLAKGWGYAEYIPTSVQPDSGAGLTKGIIGLVNKGQPRSLDDWGVLRAWAWGASRALDYFETDKAVNAKEVGLEGHSRYGKAALIAMAYDQRFAIAYVSSSGKAGAELYRRRFGEEMGNIATDEYYWMGGNFMKYDGPLTANDMPVDSHELIAMCAPRPVFISGGATNGDGWVDAHGMFMATAAASPVYELLGKKGLGTDVFPPITTPLISGDLGFRQHTGGHTPAPNWPTFIEFASRYLQTSQPAQTSSSDASFTDFPRGLEVAFTFDDLPAHGPLPPGVTRLEIAHRIIAALKAANSPPVYGFVNTVRGEDPGGKNSAPVLSFWRASGFPLGNHTYEHMDLNTNTTAAFEQSILKNEVLLRKYMDHHDYRWLRFPYLNEGKDLAQHRQIEAFLKQHHYRVAEVTYSFSDYAYNEPYARCAEKNDSQAIDWLKQSYLQGALEDLSYEHKVSTMLYGRDIKYVLLMHIGGFDSIMLPSLLSELQQRGVKLISLPDAISDPIYSTDPVHEGPYRGTYLQEVMQSRHMSGPPISSDAQALFGKLNSICK
jgi:(4-O-methyl)-D-glucuronate---lignin esterase